MKIFGVYCISTHLENDHMGHLDCASVKNQQHPREDTFDTSSTISVNLEHGSYPPALLCPWLRLHHPLWMSRYPGSAKVQEATHPTGALRPGQHGGQVGTLSVSYVLNMVHRMFPALVVTTPNKGLWNHCAPTCPGSPNVCSSGQMAAGWLRLAKQETVTLLVKLKKHSKARYRIFFCLVGAKSGLLET